MITYKNDIIPEIDEVIEVYRSSGINRPIQDYDLINQMYTGSNLIVTAWDDAKLVGVGRAVTDFCYCCYLSDLAVRADYQKQGVGKKLIAFVKEKIGDRVMLLLLSAPEAMDYYPKVGFETVGNGFMIKRTQ